MATIALEPASLVFGATIRPFKEAASQSFKKGQFVYLVSGLLTVNATDDLVTLGMAMEDASGVTNTERLVAVADNKAIFRGNVYGGVTAEATCRPDAGPYALYVGSNKCHVDITDTGHDMFVIEHIDDRDTLGDTQGRVYFRVAGKSQQGKNYS